MSAKLDKNGLNINIEKNVKSDLSVHGDMNVCLSKTLDSNWR